jgi:hypothetical protein
MPRGLGKLNVALIVWVGCTRRLDLALELARPASPDPFEGVETLRVRGVVRGVIETLGEDRWDQGPVALEQAIEPDVERFVVEGLSPDRRVVSSGASVPLDLLSDPPDGPITIYFSEERVLSRMESSGIARRSGAAAVTLAGGGVLLLGGRDGTGCMVEATEVVTAPEQIAPGPAITGGRSGRFFAGRLPSGQVIVLGGEVAPDCGAAAPSPEAAIVDVEGATSRVGRVGAEVLREGVALAVVSDTSVIVAGGVDRAATAEVFELNPATLAVNRIGSLESPRAHASSLLVSDRRVLLVGGRSSTSSTSTLATATVFVPDRGAPLAEQIRLIDRAVQPTLARTRAGNVIVAGGGSARVDSIVVRTERDFPLGDTSTVAALSGPLDDARAVELGDGSVLFLPASGGPIVWARFLPGRVETIAHAVEGPLVGGLLPDGRAVLSAGDGALYSFNPGVASAAGVFGAEGVLASGEHELGIVPLRPSAWTRIDEGLAGFRAAPAGSIIPEELAVLDERKAQDFEVAFDLSLEGLAKAALVFGIEDDRFDFVELAGASFVDRAPPGESRGRPMCTAAETRVLATPGFHRVRVRRAGPRVTLDVGADGTDDLACDTPRPEPGRIALGVVTGRAVFDGLELVLSR